MGLVVTLQHNGTRDLRGCMIVQSTTWPWRAGVTGCRQSNALQSKRTWRIRESCLRLVLELLDTVCDAISDFNCDWCSSRLLSSSTANQNDRGHRCRRRPRFKKLAAHRRRLLCTTLFPLSVSIEGLFEPLSGFVHSGPDFSPSVSSYDFPS